MFENRLKELFDQRHRLVLRQDGFRSGARSLPWKGAPPCFIGAVYDLALSPALAACSISVVVEKPRTTGIETTRPPAASTSSRPTISVGPQSAPFTSTCGSIRRMR